MQNLPFAIYPRTYFILYLMHFYLKQHNIFHVPSRGSLSLKISGLGLKDEPTCSDSKETEKALHFATLNDRLRTQPYGVCLSPKLPGLRGR